MGCLRIKANERNYKKNNRTVKEPFINRINEKMMAVEIIKELISVRKIADLVSQ